MIISLSGQCTSDRYKLFQSYNDEKVMNNGFLNEHRKKIMNCSLNEIRSQWTGSQTVLQTQEFCISLTLSFTGKMSFEIKGILVEIGRSKKLPDLLG